MPALRARIATWSPINRAKKTGGQASRNSLKCLRYAVSAATRENILSFLELIPQLKKEFIVVAYGAQSLARDTEVGKHVRIDRTVRPWGNKRGERASIVVGITGATPDRMQAALD